MLEIFITDLCAYNNGFLIGKWITLPLSGNELVLLKNSNILKLVDLLRII